MITLIHILGADIPHHNQSVLQFFNDVLAKQMPVASPRRFMVVSEQTMLAQRFPALEIQLFPTKRALVKAVISAAACRQQRFFCHGQYNQWFWLALLTGKIKRNQCYWHVWGADLYEVSCRLKFRIFYWLRRRAQGRVAHVFATRGDISYFRQQQPLIPTSLLYFPARLPVVMPDCELTEQPFTILVGNSGDRSNRHIEALEALHRQFGTDIQLKIPLGYPENNHEYISQIRHTAERLFPNGQVELITEKLGVAAYLQLITCCHLGYFIFARQQGIGTLSLLIQANIPFVLSRQNPFWQDLQEQGIPLLFDDIPLCQDKINVIQQQLVACDKSKLAFFYPGYLTGWRHALELTEGDRNDFTGI